MCSVCHMVSVWKLPYLTAVQSDLGSILEYCVNFNRDLVGIWVYYIKLGGLGNIWEYYVNCDRLLVGIWEYYVKLCDLGSIWE